MSNARDIADSNLDGLTVDTTTLVVDSTNNRVGIGTSSPNSYDSRANNLVVGDSGDAGITIFSGASSDARLQFSVSGATGLDKGLIGYDNNTDTMSFATGGSDRMVIDSGGNAIFTKSSGAYLQLKDASAVRGAINVATSDGLIFTTGSSFTERMRINSSGNVGIGTSSPTVGKLQVNDGSGATVAITRTSGATSGNLGVIRFGNTDIDSNLANITAIQDGATNSSALTFETQPAGGATTERLRIDSSGNVGIGTSSPSSPLHIQADGVGIKIDGTADTTKTVFLRNTGTGEGQFHTDGNMHFLQEDASKYMRFSTANTEAMRIDSSGNVLIGTTSSVTNSILNVDGGVNVTTGIIGRATNDVFTLNGRTQPQYGCNFTSSSGSPAGISGYYGLAFATAATERARIDSSGRFLFKKTATGNTTRGVEINGAAGGSGSLSNAIASGAGYIEATATGNGYQSFMNLNMNSSTATGTISFQTQASLVGSIQWSSTSTSYNTTSDYRLKENVTGITDGIERVKQLNPSRFNFIADADRAVDGFLAHEAATVVPEAVTGEKDAVDDEGNPEYQGIDQAKLVPLLTAALKEAITKIEDLEERVATLEGN